MREWDKGVVLWVFCIRLGVPGIRLGVFGVVYSGASGVKDLVMFHADHHCLLPLDEIMFGSNTLIHYRPSRHGPGPDYVYKLYRGDNEES